MPPQDMPDQLIPPQDMPPQLMPDQLIPDHEASVHVLPFQSPPTQLASEAHRAAQAEASQEAPKMSCSPRSSTPS
jgi:hypothetical protein